MTTSTVAILQRARGYIERGWCQRSPAKITRGIRCDLEDPRATQWCVIGAVTKAGLDQCIDGQPMKIPLLDVYSLFRSAAGIDQYAPLPDWNDAPGRTQEQVLQAFTRAIELAEKRESAE